MTQTVFITGASRGIGKAIALYLAPLGYTLALGYHTNETAARETLAEVQALGATARLIRLDVSNRTDCADVLAEDMAANGVYYGVICNAGIAEDAPFPLLEGDMWDRVLDTNLDGFYNVLHPIIMPMVENRIRGRIIALSSVSGLIGNRGQVNYSAAKAGIIGAAKALAVELAKHKITVNCIAPGIIETDMTKDLPMEEIKKSFRRGASARAARLPVWPLICSARMLPT